MFAGISARSCAETAICCATRAFYATNSHTRLTGASGTRHSPRPPGGRIRKPRARRAARSRSCVCEPPAWNRKAALRSEFGAKWLLGVACGCINFAWHPPDGGLRRPPGASDYFIRRSLRDRLEMPTESGPFEKRVMPGLRLRHPRLANVAARKSWMARTSSAMTETYPFREVRQS
jgi:hypothetical protein